jgi:hypothetical protein
MIVGSISPPWRSGVRTLRGAWIDRYGDAAAGALIVSIGAALAVLGL